ncbi:DegT/DnrJ/EryC1/StrS family aminotransferase [Sphingomonas sp. PB2P19]|uniref:DegT/DnrJ/EryC1/StrS family aminotransferase n=1 Tax=Sphingomonas rhamnosi TaxID=3096156 RepID=UPI002FC69549
MSGRERVLVSEVFDSNWIAPIGPMVDAFERKLGELTGMPHVAALSSGTAALHLALRIAGIGEGDAVWCPSMTFIGGVAAIGYVGARPVFVDCADDGDMLIDLDLLEEALSSDALDQRPRAVITTDLYGNVVDMQRMRNLADRYGFVWISDTAEAVGSYRKDHHAGYGADFVILSFNGNKIITTSGGGALASSNAAYIEQARFLATQARDPAPHYEHSTTGYNYRLSNVCAAIGVGQLEVLADRVAARRGVYRRYYERLSALPGIAMNDDPAGTMPNRWLTTLFIDPVEAPFDRESVRLALLAEEIESRPLWKPMHLQPVYAGTRMIGDRGHAERAFELGLCLPSGSSMTEEDVDRVCGVIEQLASARG